MNKAVLVVSLLLLLAVSPASASQNLHIPEKLAALEKLPQRFSFIVVGDNRSGDEVYKQLVGMVMERRPDFIVNTGDMIATPGSRDEWTRFREMSKPITVPYFLTVGNHDAHIEVAGSEQIYKDEVELPGNELYYSFVAGNSLFVVLDSFIKGEDKRITGEQFRWLEAVLSGSKQTHKFVFVHHPFYPDKGKGKHHGNSLDRYPRERDALQALMVKFGATMVFTGHEHIYSRKTVDGIPHIIAGGGGAPLYADELNGGFHHFIIVTVDGGKVSGEVVDISGKVRDRF